MYPVIVCIAKKEHNYIEEFIRYHLALGFTHIYLYDNEDQPTYENMLHKYKANLEVIHLPHNNYDKGVQYKALDHFIEKYLQNKNITHVAHIDIDEFIVLKKHKNIIDFINDYIKNDCQGIGINWRFFGSSGHTEHTNSPVSVRFTMCQTLGNHHIKTIFKKDNFSHYITCHDVVLKSGHIKSTNGDIFEGPLSPNIITDVIQLNHYKCKTLPEYKYIRTRQRADIVGNIYEDVEETFNSFNVNDVQDLTAHDFYLSIK